MKYRKVKTLIAAIRKDLGVTDAQLEHALDLEHGAIKRAEKAAAPSPELMALLKIVYTYPWMLKVADRNYDQKTAMKEFFKQAVDGIVEAVYQ